MRPPPKRPARLPEPGMACARAVFGASYLLAASGGPAPPGPVEHADGGVYRGQWAGARKAGLGVYRYPSGAVYAGQWADNAKHGAGVYAFPKARARTLARRPALAPAAACPARAVPP